MAEFRSETDKKRAQYRLALFLQTAIEISLEASPNEVRFGHPCRRLIREAIGAGVGSLANHLLNIHGEQGEYRLNGAGLKLWWRWEDKGDSGQLVLSVGGDQASQYPLTLPQLKKLIADNQWGSDS